MTISRSETITAVEHLSLPGEGIRSVLDAHARQFSPLYQGYLSDHGPMAALALHGLGRAESEVLGWYQRYCGKLSGIEQAPAGYLLALEEMQQSLAALGRDALLTRALPGLISGWSRNAYHPLIRLAYGYQFQIDAEVAAGLAYLKWCGPDDRMEQLAGTAAAAAGERDIPTAFRSLAPCAANLDTSTRFDERLATVLAHPGFDDVAKRYPDPLTRISRTALTLFDQTHDFFALHLVTGAHAFRLLYPFAGALRDEIFSLGILAGYAAIGAPAFTTDRPAMTSLESASELARKVQGDDDHDIKLAYSALSQAKHFEDSAYLDAALRYLDR